MSFIRKAALLSALSGALAMTAPLAYAETALSTVNVRSGPGTGYGIVDVLRPGQQVDVTRQSSGWCFVVKSGPDGWVSCRYLTADDGDDFDDDDFGDDIVLRPQPGRPDVGISFSIPGFSFSIGDPGFDRRPIRPGRGSQVCFFEDINYGGDSFCARSGENIASLGRWNDRISSIRVRGDADALVCEHSNFRGRCVVISRNVRNLGGRGNDIISSIRVR
jgi:hypothetical protein